MSPLSDPPHLPRLRAAMVGLGMIFDETYRPFFEQAGQSTVVVGDHLVDVGLTAVVTRTGQRAALYATTAPPRTRSFTSYHGSDGLESALRSPIEVVCVATPDARHFDAAFAAIDAGKHVLIEKPSVLSLEELDSLVTLASERGVLAKIVYHKLFDPDHKKLRTHIADGVLQHVNNGFCSLLEPKSVSSGQFAEWIHGRNPATYVAVHYVKMIDFTFGPDWQLVRVAATGQRGIVSTPDGDTWDSVQLQIVYAYPDGREAAFDIHTSWVTPENFPGYVEQQVQFRFDNGVWIADQRKRGVELTVERRTPLTLKETPNHHYNGTFLEPWGERSQRGYGVEAIRRFFEEVAQVEFGGPAEAREARLSAARKLQYNDLASDRNCVAVIQSCEALLAAQAAGSPGSVVQVNGPRGGLALFRPGQAEPTVLYPGKV